MKSPIGRDHPRIRGEHREVPELEDGHVGIIPAYAGSTDTRREASTAPPGSSPHTRGARIRSRCASCAIWDHPRIRGEHLAHADVGRVVGGIIPAYAGSTTFPVSMMTKEPGSSPHTRGAQSFDYLFAKISGDHPRIRGEHDHASGLSADQDGIIPAYAGSTT